MDIKTFDNQTGPSVFFRAAGHPLAAEKMTDFVAEIARSGPVALFDPDGHLADLAALYDLSSWAVDGVYVQRLEDLGQMRLGHAVRPVTALHESHAATVVAVAFDHDRLLRQLAPVLADGVTFASLDAIRLPDEMLTIRRTYLDPLNFAADFVLFRDGEGWHTRLATGNYWHSHGARATKLWLRCFDADGNPRGSWWQDLPAALSSVVIDSRAVRDRLGGAPLTGSLFLHAIGTAGHDVIKYALDVYGDDARQLSCTHDSNPWPADYYAGLPAPDTGETVRLWVQNCHPTPIPAGGIALNIMGQDELRPFPSVVPAFGSTAIDVAQLFPDLRWPQQLEIASHRHIGRPRYEVTQADQHRYIAHANVERTDLKPDPHLPDLIGGVLGKGYILPGSVLPLAGWHSFVLPTPMSRMTAELPFQIAAFTPDGLELARLPLGRLARGHGRLIDTAPLFAERVGGAVSEYGHVELTYDFAEGGGGDGWIHALFRYRHLGSGQIADTSFGAHLYNLPVSYKKEPQSYIGRPPGLTTRLFLRVDGGANDTLCHLIYPCSDGRWHKHSDTRLILHDGNGVEIAQRSVAIARGGSLFWRYHALFDAAERRKAGEHPYVIVRDATCRLFGYHGLANQAGGFAYDHMFGF